MEEEFRETRLVWDVIGIIEVRRQAECFIALQSGHIYNFSTNIGQAGEGFLINSTWKDHIMRLHSININEDVEKNKGSNIERQNKECGHQKGARCE